MNSSFSVTASVTQAVYRGDWLASRTSVSVEKLDPPASGVPGEDHICRISDEDRQILNGTLKAGLDQGSDVLKLAIVT